MRILLLGGPKFLGRAVIEAALAGGHEVTLFNRGQTNPEEFPQVERLPGDRSSSVRAGLIVGPHDPTGRCASETSGLRSARSRTGRSGAASRRRWTGSA